HPTTPAAPKPSPARLLSPFTGEPVTALGPVLAAKIDNLASARPQTGLSAAGVVDDVPVAGGLTPFLALVSAHRPPVPPPVCGPGRSAAGAALDAHRQCGRPAPAYPGAQPEVLPVVETAQLVALSGGRGPVGASYFRDPRRVAPHNLYARTSPLLAEAP